MRVRSILALLAVTAPIGPTVRCVVAAEQTAAPTATAVADPLDDLEPLGYQPLGVVSGTLKLAGSTTLQQAAALWSEGFAAVHPDAAVEIASAGSEAGWQAILEGTADVALLSRPVSDAERTAFEATAAATGKKLVVVPAAFERLAWIVHAENPAAEIRWSPDTGVVAPAADGAGVTWGRLGTAGEQAAVRRLRLTLAG